MNELLEELKNNERVNFRTMAVKVRDVHVCVFNGCIVFKKARHASTKKLTLPLPTHPLPTFPHILLTAGALLRSPAFSSWKGKGMSSAT